VEGETPTVDVKDFLARIKLSEKKEVPIVPVFYPRKISLRDAKFSFVENGTEVLPSEDGPIGVIIIKAAPISRSYYAGEYNEASPTTPTCWDDDTREGRPSTKVPEENVQSPTCFDCKWNIKGSGKGESRACRFHQRIVVMLTNNEGDVVNSALYQIQLPATSIFGDNPQKMAMQSYARHLNMHKTPLASVITEIRFDTTGVVPKLLFKPKRPVTEEELKLAVAAQRNSEVDNVLANTTSVQSPFSTEEGFIYKK
jgi:hypothetical protein|tara:strand:- start:4531 stop:5295 length:765 start_codon:yes stop_codon:yes gene_type:complete